MAGRILEIYIAERDKPPASQQSVQAEAEKGIVGDRYHNGTGTFSDKLASNRKREITFIAAEEIDRFNQSQNESLGYGDVRRNIVTQGINLKELIGKEFTTGSAKFLGIDSEDGVISGFWKISICLHTAPKSEPEQPARAYCNERLVNVVSAPL